MEFRKTWPWKCPGLSSDPVKEKPGEGGGKGVNHLF